MSKTVSKFTLAASVLLAMVFTLSCSLDDIKDYVNDSSSSSGGEAGNSFSYCLINGQCLSGPFTSKECGDLGGLPNNSCNGSGGNPSSSSNGGGGGNPGGGSSSSGGGQGGGGGGNCTADFGSIAIGSQVWAKKNLNCDVGVSKCYDDDPANCIKYGRLYDWNAAKMACPNGWHLPNNDEWQTLVDLAGGNDVAGAKLKAKDGWEDCGPSGSGKPYLCEDEFGFSALPGRYGFVGQTFGSWWSATEGNNNNNYRWYLYGNTADVKVGRMNDYYLYSVRCVQD